MMYRPVGTAGADAESSRLGFYVYHLDQPRDCGEIMEWNDAAIVSTDRWHCIEAHIRLNDPEKANGSLSGWVDGAEAFARDGLRFRVDDSVVVDDLWMNVFSGGKRPSAEHLALRIDEVALSTSGRIGCPDAFDDDEEDPNEAAINKLADLGVLEGCGEFLVCPSDAVSRRTFLDLVEAAGGTLSAESAGAFKDVTSGSDQPVAAAVDAGLLDVCGGELVCPESPITRAESARVIASAFGLPAGTPDAAFDDVEDATTSAAAAAL
jgi:hypothetical protein